MPAQRLAHLREEIQVIDQERDRVATQLSTITGALDMARTEMFTAFSALRRVACIDEGAHRQMRRDDAKHLRDAYAVTKQEWGTVMQQERELRARLAALETARTDRLREHRYIYQSLAGDAQEMNQQTPPDPRSRESA